MVNVLAMTSPETQFKRETVLKWFFEGSTGYIRFGVIDRNAETKTFEEFWFKWPEQRDTMMASVSKWSPGMDVYFSPMLFTRPKGEKAYVQSTPVVYADLDACEPDKLKIQPHMVVLTSTGRYQGYWKLDKVYAPAEVEEMSRRIAYTHLEDGADKSGWDLGQLLRLPFTQNFKYTPPQYIKVIDTHTGVTSLEEMAEEYTEALSQESDYTFPHAGDLPAEETILLQHRKSIHGGINRALEYEPEEGTWSETLWKLFLELFEAGLNREEVLVLTKTAACNKFARDGKGDRYLWKDICRAWGRFVQIHKPVTATLEELELLTPAEIEQAKQDITFVEEYVEWASSLGDAATQYHEAGAFVILSSLLAGNVRLPTSYGVLLPNVWFMILADTTLTRKTTAMDLAMDLLIEIDPDAILATDGSIEGLFGGMSMRPGRPSVFLRDEFSGLIEQMTKKDYYAGMAETLTKLYDGKYQKRILRREVVEVRDPVLILFAGGIRNRVLSLLSWEHVASGFLPRFVFITAESDVARLRPLGPPSYEAGRFRDDMIGRLRKLHGYYTQPTIIHKEDKTITIPGRKDATLTDEAWTRFATIESTMLEAGLRSAQPELSTPTMDRLCKSGLKIATLIAAARNMTDPVVIDLKDIIKAFSYIDRWRRYTAEVMDSLGKSSDEKELQRVYDYICRHEGCLRSEVMQRFALMARRADAILGTLEQRDMITRSRHGRAERLYQFNIKETV